MTHEPMDAATYWQHRYLTNGRSWSGNVNASLERELAGVAPGTALDLGCGEGGDALWLARAGWAVTAVDIAPAALAIGKAAQQPDDDITWVAADLADWRPPATYDLVAASFLHSTVELPRDAILRRAAGAVAPGGRFIVIGHAGVPHWASEEDHRHDDAELPSPEEMLAILFDGDSRLEPGDWTVATSELVERKLDPPRDGHTSILDSVLALVRT